MGDFLVLFIPIRMQPLQKAIMLRNLTLPMALLFLAFLDAPAHAEALKARETKTQIALLGQVLDEKCQWLAQADAASHREDLAFLIRIYTEARGNVFLLVEETSLAKDVATEPLLAACGKEAVDMIEASAAATRRYAAFLRSTMQQDRTATLRAILQLDTPAPLARRAPGVSKDAPQP